MKATGHFDDVTRETVVSVRVSDLDAFSIGREIYERAITLAATELAARFVEQHAQDVLAAIRPEAVATLVAAESAASIRKAIHQKFPDKIVERVRREVWQRGIFGGMRRL